MATYPKYPHHTLTETEIACGVTMEQVARERALVWVDGSGDVVHVRSEVSPALGDSVARLALGSDKVRFLGIGSNTGFLMYERVRTSDF